MQQPYSQVKAMLAITKASLKATLRSPSAVVFSIVFPLTFFIGFGFMGKGPSGPTYKIVIDAKGDTSNIIIDSLKRYSNVKFIDNLSDSELKTSLHKGRITGILRIDKTNISDSTTKYKYQASIISTNASSDKVAGFMALLENIIFKTDKVLYSERQSIAHVTSQIEHVREYKTIDFILPGLLGFSLLGAGVFAVAFLFYNLRQQLVLKRFFATPVSGTAIILGEGLSRVIFQLFSAILIIALGYFAFGFTLIHGWLTFIEIVILCFIALLVFMGLGFIVSGLAKSDSIIPPLSNMFTLPQFLLAGTFFPIDVFPSWLQPVCKILPLTYFNDIMRNVAFEGAHLTDCWLQLGMLCLWGVVIYTIAIKVFRWE